MRQTAKMAGQDIKIARWAMKFRHRREAVIFSSKRGASQASTNAWAKSGVMMRANLDGNAAHVTMTITPGHGAQMVYRGANGNASTQIGSTMACTAPYWVRLTRVRAGFTGFISPDGVNWRQMGTVKPATGASVPGREGPVRLACVVIFDTFQYAISDAA
ncbi:hypothetical protein GTP81_05805 [Rugamonas sp. FT107W]|uniref:Uncharacterized protein n=1 Tax=Duganella vulcania TaxID=2692166 RepID=A0A845HBQ4_9BURK|nr:hypothetical protein [Duganella vulcania]MYN16260.1 hypothetical protein [Duganella vulcania]